MPFAQLPSRQTRPLAVCLPFALLLACGPAQAERDFWIGDIVRGTPVTSGPSTIPSGVVASWSAATTWNFSYHLYRQESFSFSAQAQSFQEFARGEFPATVAGLTAFTCAATDCIGKGSITVSYTATGAFEPPSGYANQDIYLEPEFRMLSPILDPHAIYIVDFLASVPKFHILVTSPVPEPDPNLMLLGGGALALSLRGWRRRRAGRAAASAPAVQLGTQPA
ncbi:PEP-CTERM sorting domain-containing protein [Derxia lacustris]|uniref:PEP-CTERM sorting domain-containing protein n=1 Tax=Derxia lacustris TaxID=764842 RepID=UPI000A16DA77|nr:PEP-CTERM sorting domain-containing protein [Derxia lacustris]